MKLMIERGAKYDLSLHWVAAGRYTDELMSFLMEKGAKIDVANSDGQTPLHLAVQHGYAAMAKQLCEKGVRIDVRDNNDQTPLHLAVSYGHLSMVKLLLEKGAEKIDTEVVLDDNY